MFVKGTQIFTDSAWKNIEDISGNDRVLVKNFIGDAEFIQPFALKKTKYKGSVIQIGGRDWGFTTTPDHNIVYDKGKIHRHFKYLERDEYKPEKVAIVDEFGKRWVTIPNEDWFVLVAYVLCRGKLEKLKFRKYALQITLDADKRDEEIKLLSDILDRMGVGWSLIPKYSNDRWIIRVNSKNSLAIKMGNSLGSKVRKQMYIPDKMIYNGSRSLSRLLINTIIAVSKKKTTKVGRDYEFISSNEKLINSLVLLCTLSGYSTNKRVLFSKGTDTGVTVVNKNVYILLIGNPTKSYRPTYKNELDYNDYVYEINLFDGQVYVKEKGMPVWVNPK